MKLFYFAVPLLTLVCSCSTSDHRQKNLKVAASAVPHAEILEFIQPDLADEGIQLEVIVIDDYNIPNRALADKEVDANFFQHVPFLDMQKEAFGYKLEEFIKVHLEPMGLYSKKIRQLSELQPGAVVAVPLDPVNQARALLLLEKQKLITLNRHDTKASIHNISDNPLQLRFEDVDAPLLSRALDDVDLAAITTNFALQGGLSPKSDALAMEDGQSLFVNSVVIREGDEDREDLKALKQALTTEKVRTFINKKYKGAVIPAF